MAAKPDKQPFQATLLELGSKRRYGRPYRRQTNCKVERFGRTLDDDVIEGATFDNPVYYEYRPHNSLATDSQGICGYQIHPDSLSELLNIHSKELSGSRLASVSPITLAYFRCRYPRNVAAG